MGAIAGLTDETAVSVMINGILFPDGVEVLEEGNIGYGIREGNFFWASINIPQVDGTYPFTAVVTNAEGGQTEATVYLVRETVPPILTVTSPSVGFITNTPTITISGTVDDPEATVRIGWTGPLIPVVNGTFITTYVLSREGSNYLTITAEDPAGNFAFVSRTVILDTLPPQISVTQPAEGKAANTFTLSVSGSIVDQNINEVTVSVNNGQPRSLILIGKNFSGTVTLNPGSNTLTFRALDKAGNSGSVTRSVLLDLELPTVAITAPQLGAIISGVVTITAEVNDLMSGITSATLYVDGQAQATLTQPPFNFTLNTSMFASGTHTITVRAKDRAGNESETSVSVAIDNAPPIVAITEPLSGVVVSGVITVSVQANDAISGVASVSLYLDGLLQAALTQPPFNFPLNTLPFASGPHTIGARAVDNSGNQAESSILIVFDPVPPVVSITSPASGAIVSGIITVTVEANDSISGVGGVTLYIDNQLHSTLNQPPFNFTVDTSGLTPASHTLTARAVDRVGNQSEASITIMVVEPVRIEIISPANGANINKSNTIVQGRIYNQAGEVGVVINGILVEVHGGDFAAIVPLQIGQNVITATATRPDGLQGQTQITINTESQEEFVRLTATPTTGVLDQTGILNITFEAEAYLVNPVSSYSWDFNGDGTPEITGAEATVIAQYQFPGLYFPRVTVTDNQGNIYTETTLVNVLSREEMDAFLRSKWEGMKGALSQGDIEGAISYFDDSTKSGYKEHFTVLSPMLPQIVQVLNDIQFIGMMKNAIEYDIRTTRDGIQYSFYLLFIRDKDGLWKIRSF
jgi:PKD repeat protein